MRRKAHLKTHTALTKCGTTAQTPYTLLCSWLESFLSSPANTQGEAKNTTMNKSYGGAPKPTVGPPPFLKRDKEDKRGEPETKRELKGKRREQTPLWSFDGALLWNMPFLDFLLNPSSVELIM